MCIGQPSFFGQESDLPVHLQALIFFIFFGLSFFSFSFLFAAVIDLLLGLLAVLKTSKESIIEMGVFYHGVAMFSGRKLCSTFEHFCAYLWLH